jgi:peroxiredoxin-like protein
MLPTVGLGGEIPAVDDPRLATRDACADYQKYLIEVSEGKEDVMKPLPHRYAARIAGDPGGYATLSSAGVPDLRTAAPLDFDGPGDAWSPEQLLLAAVDACFLLTFRAVAEASRLEFVSMSVEVEGVVDRVNGVTRFTEIVLRPRVVLPAGGDRVRLQRALEKAERACLVAASLDTPIRLEPEIAG